MSAGKQEVEDTENLYFMNQLNRSMKDFWRERHTEILETSTNSDEPTFPIARIRKVMKSDDQVKMISGDTPVVFAKASEILIMELTTRAWMYTQQNDRGILQPPDIANAIKDDNVFSFLNNIMPINESDQSFFTRLVEQEMQDNSSSRSSPPLTPADEDDPYLIFKNYFPS